MGEKAKQHAAVGGQEITYRGALALCVNNIAGPGMLAIPMMFQDGGWLMPTCALVFCALASAFSSIALAEAMARIPGNARFQKRVEFCNVAKHYFGDRVYYIMQVLYNLSIQSVNIAAIMVTMQVIDDLIIYMIGYSPAIALPGFNIVYATEPTAMPFGSQVVVSLGFGISALLLLPMGHMNLEENMIFQWFSFVLFVVLTGEFLGEIFMRPLAADPPAIGPRIDQVLGVAMSTFPFVVTMPSLINELRPGVSVRKTVWISLVSVVVLYVIFGLFATRAFQSMVSADFLHVLVTRATWRITSWCAYLFSIGTVGLGIPVASVLVRYNLYVGGLMSKNWAAFWGVESIWIIAVLIPYDMLAPFLSWTALLFSGVVNFVFPLLALLKSRGAFPFGPLRPSLRRSARLHVPLLIPAPRDPMDNDADFSRYHGEPVSIHDHDGLLPNTPLVDGDSESGHGRRGPRLARGGADASATGAAAAADDGYGALSPSQVPRSVSMSMRDAAEGSLGGSVAAPANTDDNAPLLAPGSRARAMSSTSSVATLYPHLDSSSLEGVSFHWSKGAWRSMARPLLMLTNGEAIVLTGVLCVLLVANWAYSIAYSASVSI